MAQSSRSFLLLFFKKEVLPLLCAKDGLLRCARNDGVLGARECDAETGAGADRAAHGKGRTLALGEFAA
jgi:hypothetical protein